MKWYIPSLNCVFGELWPHSFFSNTKSKEINSFSRKHGIINLKCGLLREYGFVSKIQPLVLMEFSGVSKWINFMLRSRLLCNFRLVNHFKRSFVVSALTHDNISSIMLFIYHDMHAVVQLFIRIKNISIGYKGISYSTAGTILPNDLCCWT